MPYSEFIEWCQVLGLLETKGTAESPAAPPAKRLTLEEQGARERSIWGAVLDNSKLASGQPRIK